MSEKKDIGTEIDANIPNKGCVYHWVFDRYIELHFGNDRLDVIEYLEEYMTDTFFKQHHVKLQLQNNASAKLKCTEEGVYIGALYDGQQQYAEVGNTLRNCEYTDTIARMFMDNLEELYEYYSEKKLFNPPDNSDILIPAGYSNECGGVIGVVYCKKLRPSDNYDIDVYMKCAKYQYKNVEMTKAHKFILGTMLFLKLICYIESYEEFITDFFEEKPIVISRKLKILSNEMFNYFSDTKAITDAKFDEERQKVIKILLDNLKILEQPYDFRKNYMDILANFDTDCSTDMYDKFQTHVEGFCITYSEIKPSTCHSDHMFVAGHEKKFIFEPITDMENVNTVIASLRNIHEKINVNNELLYFKLKFLLHIYTIDILAKLIVNIYDNKYTNDIDVKKLIEDIYDICSYVHNNTVNEFPRGHTIKTKIRLLLCIILCKLDETLKFIDPVELCVYDFINNAIHPMLNYNAYTNIKLPFDVVMLLKKYSWLLFSSELFPPICTSQESREILYEKYDRHVEKIKNILRKIRSENIKLYKCFKSVLDDSRYRHAIDVSVVETYPYVELTPNNPLRLFIGNIPKLSQLYQYGTIKSEEKNILANYNIIDTVTDSFCKDRVDTYVLSYVTKKPFMIILQIYNKYWKPIQTFVDIDAKTIKKINTDISPFNNDMLYNTNIGENIDDIDISNGKKYMDDIDGANLNDIINMLAKRNDQNVMHDREKYLLKYIVDNDMTANYIDEINNSGVNKFYNMVRAKFPEYTGWKFGLNDSCDRVIIRNGKTMKHTVLYNISKILMDNFMFVSEVEPYNVYVGHAIGDKFGYTLELSVRGDKYTIKRDNYMYVIAIPPAKTFGCSFVRSLCVEGVDMLLYVAGDKKDELGDYMLEIPHKLSKHGNIFKIVRNNTEYTLYDGEQKYEICVGKEIKFAINRWINGVPLSFIVTKGGKYYVVIIDHKYDKDKYFNTPWTDRLTLINHDIQDKNRFYVIEISYNFIDLNFSEPDYHDIDYYIYCCMVFQKADCLRSIYGKYINNVFILHNIFTRYNIFNNPFTHYFKAVSVRSNMDDYINRLRLGAYKANKKYTMSIGKGGIIRNNVYTDCAFVNIVEENFKEYAFIKNMVVSSNDAKNPLVKQGTSLKNKHLVLFRKELDVFISKYFVCHIENRDMYNYIHVHSGLSGVDDTFNSNLLKKSQLDTVDCIIENHEYLYKLLTLKLFNKFIKDLESVKKSSSVDICYELKRIYDYVNVDVLYKGIRNVAITVFEILFGAYIREEQYEIYSKIIDEINAKHTYNVYQLLMGRGKSAVILPLITLHYLLVDDRFDNIFLITPDSLALNTYKEFIKYFGCIFSTNKIFFYSGKMAEENEIDILNNMIPFKVDGSDIYFKNVFVIDQNNIKKILLNTMQFKKYEILMEIIKNKTLMIIDEFDTIYDPMKSRFNIPIIKTIMQPISPSVSSASSALLVFSAPLASSASLVPLVSSASSASSASSVSTPPVQHKIIKIQPMIKEGKLITPEIYTFFIHFIYYTVNTNKESPSKNVLLTHLENFAKNDMVSKNINSNIDIIIKLIKRKTCHYDYDAEYKDISASAIKDNGIYIIRTVEKLFFITLEIMELIYDHAYGFPHSNTHEDQYLAVPYDAVFSPAAGSNFAELDIIMIATVFAYFNNKKFRYIDTIRMINNFKKNEILTMVDYFTDQDVREGLSKYYDLFGISLDELKHINTSDTKLMEKITDKINENKQRDDLMKEYLETVVGEIKYNEKYISCTAIDIISSNFSKSKCGFSGMVIMNLPEYKDSVCEFTSIAMRDEDIGSVYYAILGGKIGDIGNDYMYDTSTFGNLLDGLDGYDALIDSGAFLLGKSTNEVIGILVEKLPNKKYFIYIEADGKKKTKIRSEKTPATRITTMAYNDEIYEQKDVFIYYDNKHIIGQDIKQPYKFKALVTVNRFNKLSDIAQACFRLSNLNYGHDVDFLVINATLHANNIQTREDLLTHLYNREKNIVNGPTEIEKIKQTIAYLRATYSDSRKYDHDVFFEYSKYMSATDLTTNFYIEYINKTYR